MNNQFFGDERDFYKYALLRILAGGGDIAVAVCWMLTHGIKNGGNEIAYLRGICRYRNMDAELFDFLRKCVCDEKIRDVRRMSSAIIPSAKFFADKFPINESERARYWDSFIAFGGESDLLFFDPDTGIKPDYPKKSADEYIRMSEIEKIARKCGGASLMVFRYFHMPLLHHQNQKHRNNIASCLRKIDGTAHIFCLYRKPVAYYFLVRKNHVVLIERIRAAARKLCFAECD